MSKGTQLGGLIAGAIVAVTLAVCAGIVLSEADRSKREIPVLGTVPEFEFTTRDGKEFTRDDLLGRISVVDFFFTSCVTACPVMSGSMEELYRAFDDTDEVQFVSISVQPSVDTPAVLRAYAEEQGVTDDRWQFLTGPLAGVVTLSEQGFMLPADNLPMGHSTKFALVDRRGRIRGYYNGMENKPMIKLREQIMVLLETDVSARGAAASAAGA